MTDFDKEKYKKYSRKIFSSKKASLVDLIEIRFQEDLNEYIYFKNLNLEHVSNNISKGFSVRVLYKGNWGFASDSMIDEENISKVFEKAFSMTQNIPEGLVKLTKEDIFEDEYIQPYLINPFDISPKEKIEYIKFLQNKIINSKNIDFSDFILRQSYEKKLFLNSSGASIYQERTRIFPEFSVYKVKPELTILKSRTRPVGEAYEYFKEYPFEEEIKEYNDLILEKSCAKSVNPGKYNLVIDPSNLWLTIHESIGHSTEMDRVLLYEANYAGSSFATLEGRGDLVYGSSKVNIVGDRVQEKGLSTIKYDDEGVKTGSFDIIKNGVLQNLQMNREMAAYSGEEHSNACSFADSFSAFPIQRMPNVSLLPNNVEDLKTQDLINMAGDGIYIIGDGSWSIDMQRYNFQFTGNIFYEIKNGKVTNMLKDVAYQSNTQDFWKSCKEVGGKSTYVLEGAFNCGKGQPSQVAPVSHGSPSALFENINVLNVKNEN